MLSLVSPVCEFSTVSEMAKSLFIPGIFDKTLMMVDKNTGIADLILTFVKSKSVSIIVRKNDDTDEDSETGKMSSEMRSEGKMRGQGEKTIFEDNLDL